jgi:hypothetical protein
MTVRVGILDSGVGADLALSVADSRYFTPACDPTPTVSAEVLGHGAEVARIIAGGFTDISLLDARIFGNRLITSAAAAAAGLRWLTRAGARLVNMSFGLINHHPALEAACVEAQKAGVILIASSPARGSAVWPANYRGVIRICGDARCEPGAISALNGWPADFGACPRPGNSGMETLGGGASFAAAHATGILARWLDKASGADRDQCVAQLETIARFRGRERRGSFNE